MAKTLSLYSTLTAKHELRIYEDSIRKLFGLPVRLGKITGVVMHGSGILITFEQVSGKHQNKKFI